MTALTCKDSTSFRKSLKRTVNGGLSPSHQDTELGRFTHVVSRVRLIFAIMPREGSTLVCIDDITPTTTISQLEGLAGNTPVMMPFWKGNVGSELCPPQRH